MPLKYSIRLSKDNWSSWDKKFYKQLPDYAKPIQERWGKIAALEKAYKKLMLEQAYRKEDSECWGICINDNRLVPCELFECSVGTVRKMRHKVKKNDGRCNTCPYFVKRR